MNSSLPVRELRPRRFAGGPYDCRLGRQLLTVSGRRAVAELMPHQHGTAGASAVREGERRRVNREQRVRDRHPRLGGLLLALGEPPVHERVWKRGGEGERMVAESLAKRCNDRVVVLHDRRVPGSRANIDHIAIAPSGLWVIDTKRHNGKVEVTVPLFGRPKLKIAGRDCTELAAQVVDQVALVAERCASSPGVVVRGCLCFVEAELPLLGRNRIDHIALFQRRSLARTLNKDGPLSDQRIAELAKVLVERFPSA